jgi:hypothetical protein
MYCPCSASLLLYELSSIDTQASQHSSDRRVACLPVRIAPRNRPSPCPPSNEKGILTGIASTHQHGRRTRATTPQLTHGLIRIAKIGHSGKRVGKITPACREHSLHRRRRRRRRKRARTVAG